MKCHWVGCKRSATSSVEETIKKFRFTRYYCEKHLHEFRLRMIAAKRLPKPNLKTEKQWAETITDMYEQARPHVEA